MKNSQEFCYCDTILCVYKNWGLECSCFHGRACAPMQTDQETVLRVILSHEPYCATLSPIIELNVIRSQAGQFKITGCALLMQTIFLWSFSRDHNRAGSAAFGSVYRLCRDLPIKKIIGLRSFPPLKLTQHTSTLRPNSWVPSKIHLRAGIGRYSYDLPCERTGKSNL